MDPHEAYCLSKVNGPIKELEDVIATHPHYSFQYAMNIRKGPFPAGEKAISSNTYTSIWYSVDVLKGPFPLGEKVISLCEEASYEYARNILNAQFIAGESQMSNSSRFGDNEYEDYLLDYQFRFNREICSRKHLAKHPLYALSYAIMIGGRFPEGEPAMKRSPRIWKRYQEFINDSL